MLHFKDSFETGDIRVVRHCIGAFGVNTYLIVCRKTKKAADNAALRYYFSLCA